MEYERECPGELVRADVKNQGRIPDGGWRALGRATINTSERKKERIDSNYVHAVIDDQTRLASAEINPTRRAQPPPVS